MLTYKQFMTDRIKTLADEIAKSAGEEKINTEEVMTMAREIYAHCKVISFLDKRIKPE